MKKILGISLVAMMAVTTARADIASKAYVTVDQSREYTNFIKTDTPGVQLEKLDAAIGQLPAGKSAAQAISEAGSSVKTVAEGATNGTIAVNGTDVPVHGLGTAAYTASTAYDAAGTATTAIGALDATVSQTAGAGNGQLALQVTQADGVITGVSGSIAANTYDAYGAASDVQTAIEGKMITATEGEGYTGKKSSTTEYPSMATAVQIATDAASSGASSAVNELDMADEVGNGTSQVILTVNQTDGLVSATAGQITDDFIATGANIAPSKIATDANNRFVTDTEKSTWSGKQNAITDVASTAASGQVVLGVSQTSGQIGATMGQISNAHIATDADISMAKINFPALENSTAGAYVLTAVSDGQNGVVYHWESITRN